MNGRDDLDQPEPSAEGAAVDLSAPEQEAPGSRKLAAYVAVILGLLGMVGGGLFFTRSFSSSEGGAKTPVAAVERLFDALADEDVIGVLETLLPSERETIGAPLQDIAKELGRLGILDGELDLESLNGLDLEFFDLRFASTELAPDIAAVEVARGRARYRFAPAGGVLGDFLRDLLPEESLRVGRGIEDLADESSVFATVREGDDWYVSLWYSVAENSRRDAGRAVPVWGAGVPARGAATPEAAVEQLIRAAAGFDARRLIELTPAGEARALHDYAQLFISEAEAGRDQARSDVRAKITALELSSRVDGEAAVVTVEKLGFRYRIPELGATVTYDGECSTFEFEGEPPDRECDTGVAPALPLFLPLIDLPQPDVGFAVVREGGAWYVSPTRTLMNGMLGYLKAMRVRDLEGIKEFFEFGFSDEFGIPDVIPQETPNA